MVTEHSNEQAWRTVQQRYAEIWLNLLGTAMPPAASGTSDGASFLRFGEMVLQSLENSARTDSSTSDLPISSETLLSAFTQFHQNIFGAKVNALATTGSVPIEAWCKLFGLKDAAQWTGELPGWAPAFNDLPQFGLGREQTEKLAEGTELWRRYGQALAQLQAQYRRLGILCTQAMVEKLDGDGAEISIASVRELYNLWLSSSETVYRGFAMSDEFVGKQNDFINSLVSLKLFLGDRIDEALSAFNIPNQGGFGKLRHKQRELEQRANSLEAQLAVLQAQNEKALSKIRPKSKTRPKSTSKKKRTSKSAAPKKALDDN
jgi:class III poly(R)-hydroxyalkanoic acid synthase PhaE subunit